MGNMDELLDMMITDESPSQISDKIKDIIYSKTASRVDNYRSSVGNALFNGQPEEVSDDQVETTDGVWFINNKYNSNIRKWQGFYH